MTPRKKVLGFETRRKIFKFIDMNPGLHLREISRRMNIPKTTLSHHIRYLEKNGLIEIKNKTNCEIYTKMNIGTREKELLSILRNKTICKIFLYLCFSRVFSRKELSKELEINSISLGYHLNKMVEMGIIERVTVKNGIVYPYSKSNFIMKCKPIKSEKFYRGKDYDYLNKIYKILIQYKDSLYYNALIDTYIEYLKDIKKDKQSEYTINSAFNYVIDFFESSFKPPFCA